MYIFFHFRFLSQFWFRRHPIEKQQLPLQIYLALKMMIQHQFMTIFTWNYQHKTQYDVMKIRKYWKTKWKKNLKKKFVAQGGFEPTTLGLEGERRTTELKFWFKNWNQNWWILFPTKFEKSQFSQPDVVTFEFLSQI